MDHVDDYLSLDGRREGKGHSTAPADHREARDGRGERVAAVRDLAQGEANHEGCGVPRDKWYGAEK